MIRQKIVPERPSRGRVYDFIEYKERKPFFSNPMKLILGTPLNSSYYMVENVVYKGKQILALKENQYSHNIILVEAKIENGQLVQISKLSPASMGDVSNMLEGNKLAAYY